MHSAFFFRFRTAFDGRRSTQAWLHNLAPFQVFVDTSVIQDKTLTTGPLLRICNWVGHLSQGTKNNVKRGPEKNRNFEKSKNRKIEKIEKSKNRNFADRNFLFDYFSIFHCPEREGKGIAEILRKEYWNKD